MAGPIRTSSARAPRHEPYGRKPPVQQDVPVGSWTCTCGNVNFPSRTYCNRGKCGLPRDSSMGGPVDADWQCVCGNLNRARRTYCYDAHGGAPQMLQLLLDICFQPCSRVLELFQLSRASFHLLKKLR
eukprot:TRINITY_DN1961_c0_g1_i1.p3 TRINITY_DN1961_c0_g1~~TRINITY_DN1961_c0_g1_i1.p3  ORF type:complete len:128 (-),score=7.21 TRINITY_DN1961_c0_g1_i1:68-451(-)